MNTQPFFCGRCLRLSRMPLLATLLIALSMPAEAASVKGCLLGIQADSAAEVAPKMRVLDKDERVLATITLNKVNKKLCYQTTLPQGSYRVEMTKNGQTLVSMIRSGERPVIYDIFFASPDESEGDSTETGDLRQSDAPTIK